MKDYSFGNYICALRTGRGLSQFQLGTLVGVTDKAVSKWENGDSKPRLATCYRLAEVLGVSVTELLSCDHYITIPARKELEKMNSRIWKEAYDKLAIYRDSPLALCWSRLAAEEAALAGTDAIQGFAVLGRLKKQAQQYKTHMFVAGTIGSSYAAWLLGATDVNPLPPHYFCEQCGCVEFVCEDVDGFDLPPKKCQCGNEFKHDGHSIPYEGFAKAERNGTHIEMRISKSFKPIAVKTLLDFYEGVAEVLPVMLHGEDDSWTMERYVVLPERKTKPKVKEDGFWHVGSEEYWEWQENETTYSFLLHDQLDQIDQLRELTGVNLPELSTLLTPQMAEHLYQVRCEAGAYITDQINEPVHNFDLLLRLDLLGHATGAWSENGETLLEEGKATIWEIPAAREDIYNAVSKALAERNIRENGLALMVMEKARKGLFCSRGIPEDIEKLMRSLGLPTWYPDYLKKVRYLFPKGHAVDYLLIEAILAWYKINFPAESLKVKELCK